jgi:thymidine kinase
MAKFKFKYGTMGAGKSQELLRTLYNYNSRGDKVLVLTSKIDDRYGVGKVTSRTGDSKEAIAISSMEDIKKVCDLKDNPVCVLIDEVQFFKKEWLEKLKEFFVIEHNIPIIAYGLKVDFLNNLFEGTMACFTLAEEIHEIENICKFCNKKAIMNMRVDENGKKVAEGKQVDIGGNDKYIAVCHYHYIKGEK